MVVKETGSSLGRWFNLSSLQVLLSEPSLLPAAYLLPCFVGKTGIVIGGRLRWHFGKLVMMAKRIINVDNCASEEVDFVTDAADLHFARDESLDFLCSSHVLEHMANPLKAILEWKRVLKKGGIIYTAVPDMRFTFDRKRTRTPLQHLIDDYQNEVTQDDTTHIADFTENIYIEEGTSSARKQYAQGIKENLMSHMHHHVWTLEDVKEIFEYMQLDVIYGPVLHHSTIHVVVQKN